MPEPYDPIASLWRFDGTVRRQTYALVGFIGVATKTTSIATSLEIIYTGFKAS
jgi:hypothetical protein